ncbi:MAG: YbdD/YjiX family protein [Nocardia sp.]|nr:YbdD/YjiX family protein [Nocardia sp.]
MVRTGTSGDGTRSRRGTGLITESRFPTGGLLAAGRVIRSAAGYLNAVLGGQDYQRYVAHMRRTYPERPIPTEREYWRQRYAEAERNPATRCC